MLAEDENSVEICLSCLHQAASGGHRVNTQRASTSPARCGGGQEPRSHNVNSMAERSPQCRSTVTLPRSQFDFYAAYGLRYTGDTDRLDQLGGPSSPVAIQQPPALQQQVRTPERATPCLLRCSYTCCLQEKLHCKPGQHLLAFKFFDHSRRCGSNLIIPCLCFRIYIIRPDHGISCKEKLSHSRGR